LRIAVYTIALNEADNVSRWANSASAADYLIVGDTGSTDATLENLAKFPHIQVHKIHVSPWRFDDARNAVLALIPADADVCISLDMDEALSENWRAELESAWLPGTTRLSYIYEFAPGIEYPADKIHARSSYRWQRPVHETVFTTGVEQFAFAPNLKIQQQQNAEKDRKTYLPLLELSHRENPADAQTLFWLAREYMNQNQLQQAIDHLNAYLELTVEQTWSVERSEACRLMAQLKTNQNIHWLRKALIAHDGRREIWCDLASVYYEKQDWNNCYWAVANGLNIKYRTNTYLDQTWAWSSHLYDLGAIACYNLGFDQLAAQWIQHAISMEPDNLRLANNQEYILQRIK